MTKLPALNWIVDFLESNDIAYVACGGLAARVYGSERELNDIDFYVHHKSYNAVVDFGKLYITYGPIHHQTEHWDLEYVQFNYQDQEVEIGSDKECKIYDALNSCWSIQDIDFSRYEYHEIYGVRLRVMNKSDLIAYKRQLNRLVDIEDIKQIECNV